MKFWCNYHRFMGCIEGYEVMTAKSEERLELAKLRLEHAQFNTQRLIHKGVHSREEINARATSSTFP